MLVSLYALFWPRPAGGSLFTGSDKVVHLGLFLLLAGTARWRFGPLRRILPAVVAYAVLSEVVQGIGLAERSGDVLDVVADTIGALIGWVLAGRWLSGALRRDR